MVMISHCFNNLRFFLLVSLEKEIKFKFSPIIVRCKRDQIFDWASAIRVW